MNKELYRSFNEEIQRYRNTLIEYAKKCEWDGFEKYAGRLFDYCESIEASEIEKRFTRVFGTILAVLFCGTAIILSIHPEHFPQYLELRRLMILSAVVGCCFELYFFVNFRMYMDYKAVYYKTRKEEFIRCIEQDFKQSCSRRS